MALKVACAQFAPRKAAISQNLDRIAEIVLQAQQEEVDLLVFPETATSGYFLEGGVLDAALTSDQLLAELSKRLSGRIGRPIDVVLGFYQSSDGNLYNAAAYLEFMEHGPRLAHVYRKFFLPTYGVFDEERFVSRGRSLGVFESRFGTVGILICEDIWHSFLPSLCGVAGAQLILVPSASPGRGFSGETVGNLDRYQRLLAAVSEEHGVFCVNCQLCGFEGGKGFVGGSMVSDPFGKLIAQAPLQDEHLLMANVDLDMVAIARAQSPLISDLQSAWSDIQRIVGEIGE
jgi:N-carbamoylputrescine amidase